MSEPTPTPPKAHWLSTLFGDLFRMPTYLKGLMIGALALFSMGLIGQARNWMQNPSSAPTAQVAPNLAVPSGSNGFVSGNGKVDASAPATQPAGTAGTWSGLSTKLGAGFVVGFFVGWIFRFFLKTMTLLTAAGVVIIGGLSYFNILNVDLTSAKTNYSSAITWVSDQGQKLFNVVYEKMNATGPMAVGGFFGFRRRK